MLISYFYSFLVIVSANYNEALVLRSGYVTPQSSVLPPATTVKLKVKGQEAKIIKVKGQASFLKESRVKCCAHSIVYRIIRN